MPIHPPVASPATQRSRPEPRAAAGQGYRRGEPGFRRVSVALFAVGMSAFALLYATQALLPALSGRFGVSPATSSLTVSLATGALALTIVPVSALSERYGRARVMTTSIILAAVLGLLAALSTSFPMLLVLRTAQGVALAGLPATAMAYLSEQVHRESLGEAVGLYVAGNTVGGLSGRLLAALVADLSGWRIGLVAVGAASALCVLVYRLSLPRPATPATPATPAAPAAPAGPAARTAAGRVRLLGGVRQHLSDSVLLRLYLLSMLLSGQFVTIYNLLGYRLLAGPFHLSQTVVGLVFVIYLAGTAAAATGGRLADRLGRRPVLVGGVALAVTGTVLTLPDLLPLVVVGLVALTAGFFTAHSTASGWVSRRARTARAQAAALYLCAFYAGSSLVGWLGGFFYAWAGWVGAGGFILVLLAICLAVGSTLRSPAAGRAAGAITD